jgi:hypothetical protein
LDHPASAVGNQLRSSRKFGLGQRLGDPRRKLLMVVKVNDAANGHHSVADSIHGLGAVGYDGDDLESSGFDVQREAKRLVGALLIAAPLAPVLAVILSVLSMATWLRPTGELDPAGLPLWQAALANLAVAWLGLAAIVVVIGLSTARGALPGTYGELRQWLFEIKAWRQYLNSSDFKLPETIDAYAALAELGDLHEHIKRELRENGAHWFLGTGYVNVWRLVHQAQELLVRLVSDTALSYDARSEILRFTGSTMVDGDDAVAQLQASLSILDSSDGKLPSTVTAKDITPTTRLQARDVIQVLRSKADQYRDKARIGLTRARGDVTRTLVMTTLLSYALFWIVLEARYGYELGQVYALGEPAKAAVRVVELATGATTLFLWGALVGLFGQLWVKWNASPDAGEDDFGLSISRVIAEPVLAGVAGMCGVIVLTFGGTLFNNGLAGLTNDATKAALDLQSAFLPGSSPASLLFAAVFALSPNLLISRLQQAGSTLQQNLSTSSAGDGGGMTRKS